MHTAQITIVVQLHGATFAIAPSQFNYDATLELLEGGVAEHPAATGALLATQSGNMCADFQVGEILDLRVLKCKRLPE
jgi:hypothetical protein